MWDGRVAVVMCGRWGVFWFWAVLSQLFTITVIMCYFWSVRVCVCVNMRWSFSWGILGIFAAVKFTQISPFYICSKWKWKARICLRTYLVLPWYIKVLQYNPLILCYVWWSWSNVHIPKVLQQRKLCEEVGFSSGRCSFSEGKKLWAERGETVNVKTMTTPSGLQSTFSCVTDSCCSFHFLREDENVWIGV